MIKFCICLFLAFVACLWIGSNTASVVTSLPLPLKASIPVSVEEYTGQEPAAPAPAQEPAGATVTSDEFLRENIKPGPDGQPNRFFHTPETARRAGVKKYTSGKCRNYYQGEEWFCK